MKIITFANQKGGPGKSTLLLSCAAHADELGYKVLVFDANWEQATASKWYDKREAKTPLVKTTKIPEIESALFEAENQGFDLVFIDTPGADDPVLKTPIRLSTFTVIPCRPTETDMLATPPTVATARRLNKPFAFVITQAAPKEMRNRETDKGLSMFGVVSPIRIVSRYTHPDAYGMGLGVTEFAPSSKAANEVRRFWKWIENKMEKVINDEEKKVA